MIGELFNRRLDDWFARRGYQKEQDNRIYNPNSNIANVLK